MIIFTQTIAHRHQSNYLVTPNVWHKNHKCWAHRQQSNLIAPKIKIESQMLDCTHILEIVPSPTQGLTGQQTTVQLDNPPNVWHGYQDEIINVGLYTHSRNCSFPHSEHTDNSPTLKPPKFWQKNQDRITNVGLYTHSRNCSLPQSGHREN